MTQLIDLITKLSNDAKPVKPTLKPGRWVIYLLCGFGFYAALSQTILGTRTDLALQFTRSLFSLEIILMFSLFVTSIIAAVLNIYPDLYQKPKLLKLPYIIFCLILTLFIFQLFIPDDSKAVIPQVIFHKIECASCIIFLSLLPAAIIFIILKKGATIRPLQAGLFAALASSSLGYLVLRFSEANDSIIHLLIWHYLAMLLFALFGALLGKWLLKW